MKVAYFVNQYPKVSHTFIRREIAALERQGVSVDRFALRGWDAEVKGAEDLAERARTRHVLALGTERLLANALRVVLRHPAGAWKALQCAWRNARQAERPWPYHLMYWVEACTLLLWLKESGASHVHAHFGTNSTEVVMLAHLMGGPRYSFTVHGPEEFDKPQFLHLRRKVEHAAFVVAISSYGRSQLWRWLPAAEWRKVQVVHCALEPAFFAPADVLAPSNAPRLLNIGRLCAQKGQLLLIEAAAQLAREGLQFELVLAGDGEMREPIEAAVRRHGLQQMVRITGWISSDTVREELLAARALVLPSFAEGLPVVVMEAMAVGRPVICTRIAGIPELVREGGDGWLVPPGSLADLAQAMRACLEASPATLARMGLSARERVALRHDADVEAGKLKLLFQGRHDAAV
ncbi:glycosyltransferase family 4 protein [Ideonella sp.]|uniref:glycosyltransferase family 4 protein n=1 Tax=Ideonella sp. TaxID=1929293 RepID=UPI003BB79628